MYMVDGRVPLMNSALITRIIFYIDTVIFETSFKPADSLPTRKGKKNTQ